MRTDDIIPKKEQISKVVNYILKKSPDDNKIIVDGEELINKFNYDFLVKGLIVTINYNIGVSANQDYKVDEFWGDEIRIDIAAKNSSGNKISDKELRTTLKSAFDDYVDVINRKSQSYDQL